LQHSVKDGYAINVIFGAVTSYCFQLKVDILTGFTFGSSRDDEVLGMDISFGSRCAGTNKESIAKRIADAVYVADDNGLSVANESRFSVAFQISFSSPTIKETIV